MEPAGDWDLRFSNPPKPPGQLFLNVFFGGVAGGAVDPCLSPTAASNCRDSSLAGKGWTWAKSPWLSALLLSGLGLSVYLSGDCIYANEKSLPSLPA